MSDGDKIERRIGGGPGPVGRERYVDPMVRVDRVVVLDVVARTLRTVSQWLPDGERDHLREIVNRLPRGWNAGCCPVCQETFCDAGCPLERIRRDAGFRQPPEHPCTSTEVHEPHHWSADLLGVDIWHFCPGVGVPAGQCWQPGVHLSHTWDRMMNYPEEPREWVRCLGLTADDVQHIGRSWDSTHLEDSCPCPKTACGLVARDRVNPLCSQHPPGACKTIRQSHRAADCPARKTEEADA